MQTNILESDEKTTINLSGTKGLEPEVALEDVPCPLKCAGGDDFVLTGYDRLHALPGKFDVVKCRGCGLMRTNPRPTPDTIGFYYPEDYGPYLGTQVLEDRPTSGLKRFLRPVVRWAFETNAQKLPDVAPTRMLEIGCASGAFLHQMSAAGWQVEGVEFSEGPAQAATALGYKVQTGALEQAAGPEVPVDLVVGWMVLEHLHDPIACLRKLKEWTSPGATLVLSVPNASSLEFRIFKEEWYALQLPTHIHHFTPESVALVLKAGGWSLERVFHQASLANLFMSAANLLESKGFIRLSAWMQKLAFPSGTWFYLIFPVAWIFAAFGQTGRMTVWAKRCSLEEDGMSTEADKSERRS